MTGRQGRTISGQPARSEEEELKHKSRRKGLVGGELLGSEDDGSSNHPVAKETGVNQRSNAGQDELSGEEGIDRTHLDDDGR